MARPFDHFVMFAEMRTGSNFLEANLNRLAGVTCHGEAFNPHFIGYPNREEILGMGMAARDADPAALIATIRDRTEGMAASATSTITTRGSSTWWWTIRAVPRSC